MTRANMENMSGCKLAMVGSLLLVCQVFCFLVGAIWAPAPNNSDQFLATKCYDRKGNTGGEGRWFQPRGANKCHSIDKIGDYSMTADNDNVVFAVQMPLPRYSNQLDYSRWQQNLIGVLTADIEYEEEDHMKDRLIFSGYKAWV